MFRSRSDSAVYNFCIIFYALLTLPQIQQSLFYYCRCLTKMATKMVVPCLTSWRYPSEWFFQLVLSWKSVELNLIVI